MVAAFFFASLTNARDGLSAKSYKKQEASYNLRYSICRSASCNNIIYC